jgi:DNA-binding CsgD family transcriptional regulator
MLDSTNALQRRQLVATLVNAGVPTIKIAARLGVPVSVVRTDRIFISSQKDNEPDETKGKKPPLSREARREANRYQKLPAVVAARRASVVELCAEGKTDIEIAAELGVSPATIVRDRVRLGIPPKDFYVARVERRKKVEEMMREGVRKTDMAKALGVNKMTIFKDCEAIFGRPVPMSVRAAERRVRVREMRAEKATIIQIARSLNVADMTIRRDLEIIAKEDDITK